MHLGLYRKKCQTQEELNSQYFIKEILEMKKAVFLSLTILLLLILSGCVTIDQARTNYCESLGNFAKAVVDMRQIDANSTIEEVEDARNAAARAWDDLTKSVGNLRNAQFDALEDAYKDFEDTVDDLPRDATLAEVKATVHQAALNLMASYVDISTTTCEYPQAQQMVIQQPQQQ
jgi:outer membrane murein-binding lipoprotein Lpp